MLTVFLVEDELFARDELKYLLSRIREVKVIGEAETMDEAVAGVEKLGPDVIFLDISLADGSGLDAARQINKLKKPPLVVFATAFHQHALEAFELNAIDYVTKPFMEQRIAQTIDKIKRLTEQQKEAATAAEAKPQKRKSKLAVSQGERIIMVDMDKIVYIGTEDRQVVLKTVDARFKIDTPLYEMTYKLKSAPFLRVHRGYIVNADYVEEIEPWFNGTYNLLLRDGSKVPVSRSYIKEIRDYLDF
ncbi:LytR/AlgR family response regulator transcription factor [Paenibacillus xerothermodurans]|nr:LytTR family DNA-binding domain-containing protein [Paenibacillus xerothermodurans]